MAWNIDKYAGKHAHNLYCAILTSSAGTTASATRLALSEYNN